MKALLAAKQLNVSWGSQMRLNVRWVFVSFIAFMLQKFFYHSVVCFLSSFKESQLVYMCDKITQYIPYGYVLCSVTTLYTKLE